MEEKVFVCFSSRQVKFVEWLIRMNLVTPVASANIEHPLTGHVEIQIQKYRASVVVSKCSQIILTSLLGKEGKTRLNKMEQCGMVRQISASDKKRMSDSDVIFKA